MRRTIRLKRWDHPAQAFDRVTEPKLAPKKELVYRPDIDGLRAYAVLIVIFFHAHLPGFGGGAISVDVFFVISGYLISGIAIRTIERGSFSFGDFYARRINRIFPALITVLLATLAMGWYLLFRSEFANLGKHVGAGAAFISNFAHLREVGYFDIAAEKKPLLHFWTLAIEEQFYIFWPALLALSWKIKPRFIWLALLVGLGSALLGWTFAFTTHAQTSYFLPFTRVWAMVAGFLVFYIELPPRSDAFFLSKRPWFPKVDIASDKLANIRAWTGLVLIGWSFYYVKRTMPWPSPWTTLPILGTALLISSGARSWLNRNVFSKPLAVGIGLISYPLYLWHWPLMTFARFIQPRNTSPYLIGGSIALAFLLAFLTYQFVENPVRNRTERRGRRALILLGIMTAVGLTGVAAFRGLIPPRLDSSRIRESENAIRDWTYPGGGFADDGGIRPWGVTGNPRDTVFFAGDSHMEQYWPRAEFFVKNTPKAPTAVFLTAGGCPMLPLIGRSDLMKCDNFYDHAMQRIRNSHARAVAIGTFWDQLFQRQILYRKGDRAKRPLALNEPATDSVFAQFEQDIRALVQSGKRVYVLLTLPITDRGEFDPYLWMPDRLHPVRDTALGRPVNKADIVRHLKPVLDRVRTSALRGGAVVIDPIEYLCGPTTCPTSDSLGRPLYKDGVHMRARIARERAAFIDDVLR